MILYEDHYHRGRADGEIIRLLREGMAAGRRVKQIEEVRGAVTAVETALRRRRPGQLMLIQADTIDETVQCIRRYVESISPEPAAVEEPATEAAAPAPAAAKVLQPAEIDNPMLAKSPAIAKVVPIAPYP